MLHRVYELAGVELTDDTEPGSCARPSTTDPVAGTAGWRTTSRTSGIDPAERRAALRPYQERFDVPDEPLD